MQNQSNYLQEPPEKAGQAGATKPAEPVAKTFFEKEVTEFDADLDYSEGMDAWSFYLLSFHRFLPEATDWSRIVDLVQQKKGSDIVIDGKKYQIKNRRTDYGDFLFEYKHIRQDGGTTDGWMWKYHDVDYLLYCIPSVGKAFLFDWHILEALLIEHHKSWLKAYHNDHTKNSTYDTYWGTVPLAVIDEALIDKADFKNETFS